MDDTKKTRTREQIHEIVENEFVPGTAHLVDLEGKLNVKKNAQGKESGEIVLIPQPSSNPRDPLNWSPQRKKFHYILLLIWGFFVSTNIAFAGPIWRYLEVDLTGATVTKLTDSSLVSYISLGVGCIILQPTAMKIGRRATYLIGSVLMIMALIIGGTSKSMNAYFAFKFFSSFGAAPVDSLVQVSATDIFFQHERGDKLAAFIFIIYAGSYLGPIVAGYLGEIDDGIGWRWCFWICLILQGVFLFVQGFFMEDSTFRRDQSSVEVEEEILRQITTLRSVVADEGVESSDKSMEKQQDILVDVSEIAAQITYKERMKLYNKDNSDPRPWIVIFLRPLLCASLPPVVWAGLIYGVQIMWLSLTSNTQSTFFTAEPYNFSSGSVGLTNLSSLVGSIIGMFFGGYVADWIVLKLARKNNGIVEPEMRLWLMIFPTIINAAGLLMYGLGAYNGTQWFVPAGLGRAMISIGICSCGPIVITYAIDCYPALASESVVLILFMRNLIGCGFTFAIAPWILRVGVKNFTWTLFALCVFMNGTLFVMIIFGKRMRRNSKKLYFRFQDRSRFF